MYRKLTGEIWRDITLSVLYQTDYVQGFKGKVKVNWGLRFFSELAKVIFAKTTKHRNRERPLSANDPKCQSNSVSCEINEDNIKTTNGIAHLMHCCMMNTHTSDIIKKKAGAKSCRVSLLGVLRHNDCTFTRKLFSFLWIPVFVHRKLIV